MNNRGDTPEKKPFKQTIAKLTYCLKPKIIRNYPLNKYGLNEMQSADASGAQITDHFNYGFNSETFPVYVKLCKRFVQAEDIEHPNKPYDADFHHQFRFNDDAPIDFGGFGPFFDEEFSDVCNNDQFESLMKCFVTIPFAEQSQRKGHNTMINYLEYLKYDQAYPTLSQFMSEIERKIEEKYQRTMKILKKNEANTNTITQKIESEQLSSTLTEEAKDGNFYDELLKYSLKTGEKKNLQHTKIIQKELKCQQIANSESQESIGHSLSYSHIKSESSEADSDDSNRNNSKNMLMKRQSQNHDQETSKSQRKKQTAFKADKKDRKYYEKYQKKEHKERQSHMQKKKKSKSKKIGKHKSNKSHKKHKKHGKNSKKHKK